MGSPIPFHDAAQGVTSHGDLDGRPGVNDPLTPRETPSTINSNGADRVLAQGENSSG